MHKNTLSLKSWAIVFFIVTTSVVFLSYLGKTPKFFFNLERLNKNSSPLIILMGTSLVKCGFDFDTLLEKKLSKNGMNVKIKRITHSGNNPFVLKNILTDIIKSRPDILFIQDSYFIQYQKNHIFSFLILENYKKTIINLKNNILNSEKSKIHRKENYGIKREYCIKNKKEYHNHNTEKQNNLLEKEYGAWSHHLTKKNDISYLYNFIKKIKKNGTKVILIEMGHSKKVNNYLGGKNLAQITHSLNLLSHETKVKYWRFPSNLPLDYYTDFSHLNSKGRTISTQWFINKVKNNHIYTDKNK